MRQIYTSPCPPVHSTVGKTYNSYLVQSIPSPTFAPLSKNTLSVHSLCREPRNHCGLFPPLHRRERRMVCGILRPTHLLRQERGRPTRLILMFYTAPTGLQYLWIPYSPGLTTWAYICRPAGAKIFSHGNAEPQLGIFYLPDALLKKASTSPGAPHGMRHLLRNSHALCRERGRPRPHLKRHPHALNKKGSTGAKKPAKISHISPKIWHWRNHYGFPDTLPVLHPEYRHYISPCPSKSGSAFYDQMPPPDDHKTTP